MSGALMPFEGDGTVPGFKAGALIWVSGPHGRQTCRIVGKLPQESWETAGTGLMEEGM